jgi:hypothetical protein
VLPAKQFIISVGISKTSYAEVVELCRGWISERAANGNGPARYICVTSAHGIILAKDDPSFAEILNAADIATPDGMPVVWALRSFGSIGQQRVYGPTLMLELCRGARVDATRGIGMAFPLDQRTTPAVAALFAGDAAFPDAVRTATPQNKERIRRIATHFLLREVPDQIVLLNRAGFL